MDNWTTVGKKAKTKKTHRYSENEAQRLEKIADCRFLAVTLRSPEIEEFFIAGWEYAGVRKPSDDAVPDLMYEYMSLPVKDNKWGDLIVLRKPPNNH